MISKVLIRIVIKKNWYTDIRANKSYLLTTLDSWSSVWFNKFTIIPKQNHETHKWLCSLNLLQVFGITMFSNFYQKINSCHVTVYITVSLNSGEVITVHISTEYIYVFRFESVKQEHTMLQESKLCKLSSLDLKLHGGSKPPV